MMTFIIGDGSSFICSPEDNSPGLPAGTPARKTPLGGVVVFNSIQSFIGARLPAHPPSSKSLPCIKPRPPSGSDSRAGESSADADDDRVIILYATQVCNHTRRPEMHEATTPI